MTRKICVFGIMALCLLSCQSIDFKYQTTRYVYADGFVNGYFLPGRNGNASTLVIYVDGSGLFSVLGRYTHGKLGICQAGI